MLKIQDKTRDKEYKIEDSLAPSVYLVTDVEKDVQYACKKVISRKKFKAEIEILDQISHQNIVQFFCSFQFQSNRYIIFELCANGNLGNVLKCRKKLTHPEVRCLIQQVACGLQYLHEKCIVHRNLHLSSILLSNGMMVKIGCFGHAAVLKNPLEKIKRIDYENESFVAPEILERVGHGLSSDIWSLGCVAYNAIVGKPPFSENNCLDLKKKILSGDFVEPQKVGRAAKAFMKSIFEVNPDLRPSLHAILEMEYFKEGFTPLVLSSMTLKTRPTFQKQTAKTHSEIRSSRRRMPLMEVSNYVNNQVVPATTNAFYSKGKENMESTSKCRPIDNESKPKVLDSLLNNLALILEKPPSEVPCPQIPIQPFLCVSCWASATNGGGFGYHLSDGTIGVHFRDGTHLLRRPGGDFLYMANQSTSTFGTKDIPAYLEDKIKYTRLIDIHLHTLKWSGSPVSWANCLPPHIYIVNWKHYDNATVMFLSNGSLQVNFSDHEKYLLNEEANILNTWSESEEGEKKESSFHLDELKKHGLPEEFREKVTFIMATIRDLKSYRRLFCD